MLAIRRPRDGATPWSAPLGRARCPCRWRRSTHLRFGGATLRRQWQYSIVAFGNGHDKSRWKTYRNLVSMPNDRSGRQSGGQEKSEKEDSLHVPCICASGKKSYPAGDRALQSLLFNEDCLASACHQHALVTSLLFVHTARHYYRLNGSVRPSDWPSEVGDDHSGPEAG